MKLDVALLSSITLAKYNFLNSSSLCNYIENIKYLYIGCIIDDTIAISGYIPFLVLISILASLLSIIEDLTRAIFSANYLRSGDIASTV